LLGECKGIERLYDAGAYSAEEVQKETARLLNHERGCPPDVAERLRALQLRAHGGAIN
jgi:hypothetical protein